MSEAEIAEPEPTGHDERVPEHHRGPLVMRRERQPVDSRGCNDQSVRWIAVESGR